MGRDIPHTYTLSDPDEDILVASALIGPAYKWKLASAVQLIDVSKTQYSELLKISLDNKDVPKPKLSQVFGDGHDTLANVMKQSKYTEAQLTARIDLLTTLELLCPDKGNRLFSLWFPLLTLSSEGKRLAAAVSDGRIPLVRPPQREQITVFFAAAFGRDDVDLLFANEVAPACQELRYSVFRVDLCEPTQSITNSILSGIQRSACVIADLTYARPSVYFEVGMAQGLGMPVILTCRSDHYLGRDDSLRVHFDLVSFKVSFWTIAENGSFSWPKSMHPIERLKSILRSD